MSNEEAQKVLDEMQDVRPEKLKGEAKRLFKAIMKIAEERDKYKEELETSIIPSYEETIKELEKQLFEQQEGKDKIIDKMAECIEDELTVDEFCTREGCYADNYIDGHCEKCLNCIKQYFENKASI